MTIPSNALLFRGQGVLVARVDAGSTVHLQPVKLGRNFGEAVEVVEGLTGNETLVLNPSDSLAESDKVAVAVDTRQPATPAAKATP